MVMNRILSFLSACALAVSALAQAVPFKVIAPLKSVEDGELAYLVDYDSDEMIDSVAIYDHAAVFTGEIDEPVMARIMVDNVIRGTFVLEPGTIAINHQKSRGVGGMFNDELNVIMDKIDGLPASADNGQALRTLVESAVDEYQDSPIGYYVYLNVYSKNQSLFPKAYMKALANKYPYLKSSMRVKKLLDTF